MRSSGFVACLCGILLLANIVHAQALPERETDEPAPADVVPSRDAILPAPSNALGDTVWIADWSFEDGGGCTSAGWTHYDLRILNDGSNYWHVSSTYSGQGAIAGDAAVLSKHDLCWSADGYGNNWDYGIRVLYRGATTLAFDYKLDSQTNTDFMTVEADSACASYNLVNYATAPGRVPSSYRVKVANFKASGTTTAGSSVHFGPQALPDFGVPGTTHCVYIRFSSNLDTSNEDGGWPSAFGAALVVDNVVTTGGAISVNEDFTGPIDPNISLLNTAPSTPFGQWARLYSHVTDNDKCTENTTCAWLWSDPATLAMDPSVAYGPGMGVVHNWLDDAIVSPWVSLTSTPAALSTILTFRRFFGNPFAQSKIAQNWSLRSHAKVPNTDTTDPADSVDCTTPWTHAGSWSTGGASSAWGTSLGFVAQYIATGAREIQIRWRVSDWQYLTGDSAPNPFRTGPGPYLDRVRIGRLLLSGPGILGAGDIDTQSQDCFATVPLVTGPNTGEHFQPSTDRFGTCAFSMAQDLTGGTIRPGPRLVPGDSISVKVTDSRNAGGVTSVKFLGAIVAGPHAGKAPAPWTVGGNGFFAVPGDSCRNSGGSLLTNSYFVDLDDTYFRGGDSLLYFWAATDAAGGFTSGPAGMAALPGSRAEAEAATGGLLEVSFLPSISWAQGYLDRIAADAHGDLDPTPAELAASHQAHCILYNQQANPRRLSGAINRTAMMYTLDKLGYGGAYDVYDEMQFFSGVHTELAGRANVAQATGYALIIQDDGRGLNGPGLPDGSNIGSQKINQAQWYRDYLANGSASEIGTATFWLVSENTVSQKPSIPLLTTDMGVTLVATDQGLGASPNVEGQTSFAFAGGVAANFAGDTFSLNGGCPTIRNYDALGASGTAVITHKYKGGGMLGAGAIVMNRNASLAWNTIASSFGWFDLRDASGSTQAGPPYTDPGNPSPEAVLLSKVLSGVLPANCQRTPNPVEVAGAPPLVTALYQNVPNPFNPTTKIRFDLAAQERVRLVIFDVAGRRVRTLVDGKLPARRHQIAWNGQDDNGRRVSSGVYFYRLAAGDFEATKKLVMMK